MKEIKFTEQELIELKCILGDTMEFRMTKDLYADAFDSEEIKQAKKYLMPIFKKLGMYPSWNKKGESK